ncbi:MAG: hypothetical protein ACWA41_02280 [Putridiphycobacter sp.]
MKFRDDFTVGNCYEMYFTIFNSKIHFKVVEDLPKGYKKAVICDSGHEFCFCSVFLFKDELSSLSKVSCTLN